VADVHVLGMPCFFSEMRSVRELVFRIHEAGLPHHASRQMQMATYVKCGVWRRASGLVTWVRRDGRWTPWMLRDMNGSV
jgi:hypothetical protein